jgi:hypothetical protein
LLVPLVPPRGVDRIVPLILCKQTSVAPFGASVDLLRKPGPKGPAQVWFDKQRFAKQSLCSLRLCWPTCPAPFAPFAPSAPSAPFAQGGRQSRTSVDLLRKPKGPHWAKVHSHRFAT